MSEFCDRRIPVQCQRLSDLDIRRRGRIYLGGPTRVTGSKADRHVVLLGSETAILQVKALAEQWGEREEGG